MVTDQGLLYTAFLFGGTAVTLFVRLVYSTVRSTRQTSDAVSYALSVLALPLPFAVKYLYEFGLFGVKDPNLSLLSRTVVSVYLTMLCVSPVVGMIAPVDPVSVLRWWLTSTVGASVVVYVALFKLAGFDIEGESLVSRTQS